MRALVTGGAGFIGGHLADALARDGHDVIVIDDLSSGSLGNVSQAWNLIEGDIRDERTFLQVGAPVDVVFHLASHVGQELSFERPGHDFAVNALGTSVLAQWVLAHGNPHIVFASSMNVYGNPVDGSEIVTERTPTKPPSPYAVAKLASEGLLEVLSAVGLRAASLRLFNVYGPRQDLNNMKQGMVSIFLAYLLRGEPILVRGSVERFRDFIYVDDVVHAFQVVADQRLTGVFNVGTGRKTTVRQLIDNLIDAMGGDPSLYPLRIEEGTIQDQFGICADATHLQEFGWLAQTTLEQGLQNMVEWAKTSRFVEGR